MYEKISTQTIADLKTTGGLIAYGRTQEELAEISSCVVERHGEWPFMLRVKEVADRLVLVSTGNYALYLGVPSDWDDARIQKDYHGYEFSRKLTHLKSFAEGWFSHARLKK